MKSVPRSSFALVAGSFLGLVSCGNAGNATPSASLSGDSAEEVSWEQPALSSSASASGLALPVSTSQTFKAIRPGAMHVGFVDLKTLRNGGWFKGLEPVSGDPEMRPVKDAFT